jgi:CRISPR-associated protein Cas1
VDIGIGMNPLALSGYGVTIRVNKIRTESQLWIIDGRQQDEQQRQFRFQPKRFPYTSIMIDGHSGYITFQALHWLSRNSVPLFVMNYDGNVISSILPPTVTRARLRRAQFDAAKNPKTKFKIAKALAQAKITLTLALLKEFAQTCDIQSERELAEREAKKLTAARTIGQLRTVEGRVGLRYWQAYRKLLPETLRFNGRSITSRANKASDPVNLALNYGYGYLEAECRKAINTVGLEPSIGFLHELSDYQTKQSLVYDLQEPFRWLVDATVAELFQTGKLNSESFYFAEENYRLRFKLEAKGKLLTALRDRFNSGVFYRGRNLKWDTVILQKCEELGRYLVSGNVCK